MESTETQHNLQNAALLVMDMQDGILGGFAGSAALVSNVSKAIESARSRNLPIIYVVVGFRNGAPDVSPNNKGFNTARQRMGNADMDAFMRVHTDLMPLRADFTVIKRRVSAFTGSDLEVLVRSMGIQHLVLTGISTSGVVLSTVREAADRDYRITVISDCCADSDDEVHRVLTTKIFPRQADVVTLADWGK